MVDVGERRGALVLRAPAESEGLEVEIHPVSDPTRRTHVWVLPRGARGVTVYAAVFPSLPDGEYAVLEPDGSTRMVVSVPPNQVTSASWGWQSGGARVTSTEALAERLGLAGDGGRQSIPELGEVLDDGGQLRAPLVTVDP